MNDPSAGDRPLEDRKADSGAGDSASKAGSEFETVASHAVPPTPDSLNTGLAIRCPECRGTFTLGHDASTRNDSIRCSICGSDFRLSGDVRETSSREGDRTIGHFQLLQTVGAGSFGTVWEARDTELDRVVALKIPRRSALEGSEAELFLREARSAAQLQHPNIVSVYEVGRHEDTIYIVTELVRGAPLSDWIEARRLSLRDGVALCVKIAYALHHAHEQGVVHRDLKPANILMDGEGEPHISDFGLARREVGDVTMTLDGQILGTPAYMSPEQARGEAHSSDRRSDVYSLGVILFELLTESLPFRGQARMLLHQVVHDEAPSPRKLNGAVTRDLETICLKCLEKEPSRRYPTAQELGDDLRRYLSREPIRARPVGRWGRIARWSRRNPAVAALSASVLLLLIAVAVSMGVANVRLQEEARRTRQQQQLAEDRLNVARTAIREMLQDVGYDELQNEPYFTPVRREIIRDAMDFYTHYLESDDLEARRDRARLHLFHGYLSMYLDELEDAEESSRVATSLFQELVEQDPSEVEYISLLAEALVLESILHHEEGRAEEAVGAADRALEWLATLSPKVQEMSAALQQRGRILLHRGKALAMAERVSEARHDLEESVSCQRKALAADPVNRTDAQAQLGRQLHMLGNLLRTIGEYSAAESTLLEARDVVVDVVETSGEFRYLYTLGQINNDLAVFYYFAGQLDNSIGFYENALKPRERLALLFPNNLGYTRELALTHSGLAFVLHREADRRDEADAHFQKAIELLESVASDSLEYKHQLGSVLNNYANLQRRQHEDAAFEMFQRALAIRRELAQDFPDRPEFRNDLAGTLHNIGSMEAFNYFEFEQGLDRLDEALAEQRIALETQPDNPEYQEYLGIQLLSAGDAAFQLGRDVRALANYREGLDVWTQLAESFPEVERFRPWVASARRKIGMTGAYSEHPDVANLEEARRMLELILEENAEDRFAWQFLALVMLKSDEAEAAIAAAERSAEIGPVHFKDYLLLALACHANGRAEAAAEWYERAAEAHASSTQSHVYRGERDLLELAAASIGPLPPAGEADGDSP